MNMIRTNDSALSDNKVRAHFYLVYKYTEKKCAAHKVNMTIIRVAFLFCFILIFQCRYPSMRKI
jgi:hypothetical protein